MLQVPPNGKAFPQRMEDDHVCGERVRPPPVPKAVEQHSDKN